MRASHVPGAGHATVIGNFERKTWRAKFQTYQATQAQLNATSAKISQSLPQRLHLSTLLFVQVVVAPNLPSSRLSQKTPASHSPRNTNQISSPSETQSSVVFSEQRPTHVHRSIRSIMSIKNDSAPQFHPGSPTTPSSRFHASVDSQKRLRHRAQDAPQAIRRSHSFITNTDATTIAQEESDKEALKGIENENYYVFQLLKKDQHLDGNVEDIALITLIKLAITFFETDADSLASFASQLQKANGLYGGHPDEVMSEPVQKRIVRRWVTRNIFTADIEEILQEQILYHQNSMLITSRILNQFIVDKIAHPSIDVTDLNAWILQYVFLEELPGISYFHTFSALSDPSLHRLQNMKLREFKWGQIHAGLSFAKIVGLSIEKVSIQEAAELGKMLLIELQEGVVPKEWWGFFKLPAIIRYAQDYPELVKNLKENGQKETEMRALIHYATVNEEHLKKNNPVFQFNQAIRSYKTRSQLAQKIIDQQCPDVKPSTYLNKGSLFCTREVLTQRTAPSEESSNIGPKNQLQFLPDINKLYRNQVADITNTYSVLDKVLLIAALAKLSEEDINSLSLGHIVRVGIDFTAADQLNSVPFVGGNPHARNSLMVDLDKAVEFFRVARPSQADQIYALQHNGQGYDVKQVGKDAKDYYEFLTTDKRPITDATFLLRINSYGEPLKPQEELLDAWIHRVVKKHGEQFSKQLYDYGYDKTTLEKLTDVILSFIPFYTCINSARAGDVEEATVSCSIDTIALLPLLGKLGSISFKLSQILGKGGLIATRNAINELALRNSVKAALLQGGAQFAEYGLLPASQAIGKKELVSLGTATLRAMDPGFELLGSISMTAVKQSLRLAQAMSPSLHKLHKLLPKLTLELERLPPKISPEAYSFARLPGFDKAVQVTKLGGDPFMGRDIYVRLHPETGEPFGRKYVLLADGTLDPVPIGLARRLHNVLKYGLGGKYAPQQGSNWAAQTTPITFTLLLQIRRDIESGANLQQLAARHSVELERLHRYISYTGELTALGRDQFELAKEARISTDAIQVRPYSIMELPRSVLSGPLLGLTYPINQLPKKLVVTLAAPVRANEAIRDNFDVIDGRIFEKNGTPYTYDIDLNGFIKDPLEESPFVYFIDKNTRQLRPSSLEEAQKQASSITIDERTAVIKGLGIDLDLSTILNNQGPVFGPKKPISKRISFLWIGNKALRPDVLTNLHMNCQIANRKGYKVYVYLSQQSEQLNYKKLVTAICGSATCGLNVSLQNQVSILETSNFYKKFKSSISFLQYQDAIDGNGGVATNFASAADILRLELLKSKGGLYMDVDDTLSDVFGDTVLEAEANGFVLPGLLMSKKPKMDHLFGTSFFGVHQDNAIIDAMLEEIHHRFQQSDNRDFYKTPRPSNTDLIGSIAYANKLSYLTGPDVFNRVLLEHQPVLTQFRKMSQLQELCERPYASKMLNEILEHMPSQAEITPLAHSYFVGNLHSWEQYRKK